MAAGCHDVVPPPTIYTPPPEGQPEIRDCGTGDITIAAAPAALGSPGGIVVIGWPDHLTSLTVLYRADGQVAKTTGPLETGTGGTAIVELPDLAPGTTYTIQAQGMAGPSEGSDRSACVALTLPARADALTMTVAPNKNNVLSAVAGVSCATGIKSVRVRFRADGGQWEETPTRTTPAATGGSAIVPVLGLRPDTTYTLLAAGEDAAGQSVQSGTSTFKTGTLPPDVLTLETTGAGTGYTMISKVGTGTSPNEREAFVTIVDSAGQPVWYAPVSGEDFRRQPDGTYTVSAGDPNPQIETTVGVAPSIYRQYDVLGNLVHTWRASGFLGTDGHDLRLLPNGDALLLGLEFRTVDLSTDGGAAGAHVLGNVVQRVRPDGTASLTWDAFDSVALADMVPAVGRSAPVVDFTHANALETMPDGNYLVSLRNVSQVVKIDAVTGGELWKLGGADSDFKFVDDPLGGFSMQHGLVALPDNHLLLLDNGNEHNPPVTRAVEYELDTAEHTAKLVWSSQHTPRLFCVGMGFAQRLANGHTLITYSTSSLVQEVDEHGAEVWTLSDPQPLFGIYRAFRIDSLY